MKKTDRRTRYTKGIIQEVFLELFKENPIEKITVSEICRQCEINRGTFYIHYENPYDVLEEIEEVYANKAIESIYNIFIQEENTELTNAIHKALASDENLRLLSSSPASSCNFLKKVFFGLDHQLSPILMKKYNYTHQEALAILTFVISGTFAVDTYFLSKEFSKKELNNIIHVINHLIPLEKK